MPTLRKSFVLETTFAEYEVTDILGEGGAGRVYGGLDLSSKAQVAIKVLTASSSDKRRRFKNEIGFLSKTRHENIVAVLDHGISNNKSAPGPFYVMERYASNLRERVSKLTDKDDALKLYGGILDGVEAAHLLNVVHRDLKPENILCRAASDSVAVADFGIASFGTDLLATLVETQPTQRLANFVYAAPEQRAAGKTVTRTADIYALGLILN